MRHNNLVSLLLANYQVLSEALQGHGWAAPSLAHPSVSSPESSLPPLSTGCHSLCISEFNLSLSQSFGFVSYEIIVWSWSHETDVLKSQTSHCHTQDLILLPSWSLLALLSCTELTTGVPSRFQKTNISLPTPNQDHLYFLMSSLPKLPNAVVLT